MGPNGSGKSNVIDSMLFVFGYRAQKIRSKKVSVLIHNSEKFPNLRQATVSVHFWMIVDKEGDEYDVIPDSEFVVSRTAFKGAYTKFLNSEKKKLEIIKVVVLGHAARIHICKNVFACDRAGNVGLLL